MNVVDTSAGSGASGAGVVRSRLPRFATSAEVVSAKRPAEPVYCLYPRFLDAAAGRFLDSFPGRVLYAVKANPDPNVLAELYAAGIRHFDTASLAEIRLVKGLFPEATCYFMAPSKLAGAAATAYRDFGVRHFVADHRNELERLLGAVGDDATIFIRMKAFDPESVYELSSKFGANEELALALLRRVAASGRPAALAFNVGSLCRHPDAYRRALVAAGRVIAEAGVPVRYLDVGGGFPAAYPGLAVRPIAEYFTAIREARADLDLPDGCELLCEPGRALVAAGQSLIAQVILIKDDLVFLNDGIYGSFQETYISRQVVSHPWRIIRDGGGPSASLRPYSLCGPTCDSLDVLPKAVDLPDDLREGDWIEFGLIGAYSNAMTTGFNGFAPSDWVIVDGPDAAPPGLAEP